MKTLLSCVFAMLLLFGISGCNRAPAGDPGIEKPMAPADAGGSADPKQKNIMNSPAM